MSVINILMQLRKVCNHPNLFAEPQVSAPLVLSHHPLRLSVPSTALAALPRDDAGRWLVWCWARLPFLSFSFVVAVVPFHGPLFPFAHYSALALHPATRFSLIPPSHSHARFGGACTVGPGFGGRGRRLSQGRAGGRGAGPSPVDLRPTVVRGAGDPGAARGRAPVVSDATFECLVTQETLD